MSQNIDPDYPMGAEIKFKDSNATGFDVCIGHVNGNPIQMQEHGMYLVPVWAERKGREATTVYVDEKNIINV